MNEFKILKPEVIPSKNNLYREWQKMMILKGHLEANDINEMSYVYYVIQHSHDVNDFEEALIVLKNYDWRKDLIATLYIKMGKYEEAGEVIKNIKDSSIYKEMAVCVRELSEKSPEIGKEIISYIKDHNKDYFDKLNSN